MICSVVCSAEVPSTSSISSSMMLQQIVVLVATGLANMPVAQAGDEDTLPAWQNDMNVLFGTLWLLCYIAVDNFLVSARFGVMVRDVVSEPRTTASRADEAEPNLSSEPMEEPVPDNGPSTASSSHGKSMPQPPPVGSEPPPTVPNPPRVLEEYIAYCTQWGSKYHVRPRDCPSTWNKAIHSLGPHPKGPKWCKLCSSHLHLHR